MSIDTDERAALGPLAGRPYHSLALPLEAEAKPRKKRLASAALPRVEVEQRPLSAYARIAGAAR